VSGFDAHRNGGAVRFTVRVQSRASKNEFAGVQGDSLKVRVTAPPVDGLANQALMDFLSEELGISRRNVCIVSGHTSRSKIVEVSGVEMETIKHLAD
jgi:uncharacterized protein (TIGR00251 family)